MHDAQRTIKAGLGRFNVICAGRRFGKDVLGQDRAVYHSIKGGKPVAWLAPSYRMLSDNYRMLYNTLAQVVTKHIQNERIELMGGGVIDFWSLEQPDRVRGRKYAHAILNEAAMVPALVDNWNEIIRPTLVDFKGGADFMSTPRGLNGFYELWTWGGTVPGWERFRYTTYDNPHIDKGEIDAMRRTLPERVFQQEIMAEFLEDGAFFQRVSEAAIITDADTPEQHKDHMIVIGVDWALQEDFTVLTAACRECNRVVDWQRFNQIDYGYQRQRVLEMADRWSAPILPERNSIGQPNIELLIQAGAYVISGLDGSAGWNTTASSKPQLIQALASAIEHGEFRVPVEYADELRSYQVELTGSGHTKFSAPTGQHDDRVISLALAWWGISSGQWFMT